jgi:hypothetical protein
VAWYYQRNGDRVGPVDEATLKTLAADGTVTVSTLVWHRDFGKDWRPFGTTDLYSPDAASVDADTPPPLPPEAQAHALSLGEEFLASDLTRQLVGPKSDYYLGKWTKILISAKGDPTLASRQRSWHWPAFFVPYAWLLYRKLYLLGGLIIAVQFLLSFSDSIFPAALSKALLTGSTGLYVVCAIYANGWYFDATYKKWLRLRSVYSAPEAAQFIAREGGARVAYAWSGVALVLLGVGLAVMFETVGATRVSCSSGDTTELVSQIAREQIDKDGYMMFVVDSKATKVMLKAIRTQSTADGVVQCAAEISYTIAFKSGVADPTVKAALEQTLRKDITYKMERTDEGDQIYATVYGLQ